MGYVILVRMQGVIIALMDERAGPTENISVFTTLEDAEEVTLRHSLTRAYPYQIVELDV